MVVAVSPGAELPTPREAGAQRRGGRGEGGERDAGREGCREEVCLLIASLRTPALNPLSPSAVTRQS